jgi:hypothetical protein
MTEVIGQYSATLVVVRCEPQTYVNAGTVLRSAHKTGNHVNLKTLFVV